MFAIPIILVSSALGGQVGLSGGAELVANDPFLRTIGDHWSLEYAPRPHVRFGASLSHYPDLGELGWKPLTEQLVNEAHVSPDLSRMRTQVQLVTRIMPFINAVGKLEAQTGFHAGMGLVRTIDDLEALQQQGDPYAMATEKQLHPSTVFGLSSELGGDVVRGRVRIEWLSYVEVVSSTTLEMKNALLLAGEVTVWLGRR